VADITKTLMTGPTSGQINLLTCTHNFSSYTQRKFMIPVTISFQILSSFLRFRFHINWTYTQRARFKLLTVGLYEIMQKISLPCTLVINPFKWLFIPSSVLKFLIPFFYCNNKVTNQKSIS
jgi:hypothetical protein